MNRYCAIVLIGMIVLLSNQRTVGVIATKNESSKMIGAGCYRYADSSTNYCNCGNNVTVKNFIQDSHGKKDDSSIQCGSGMCINNVAILSSNSCGS